MLRRSSRIKEQREKKTLSDRMARVSKRYSIQPSRSRSLRRPVDNSKVRFIEFFINEFYQDNVVATAGAWNKINMFARSILDKVIANKNPKIQPLKVNGKPVHTGIYFIELRRSIHAFYKNWLTYLNKSVRNTPNFFYDLGELLTHENPYIINILQCINKYNIVDFNIEDNIIQPFIDLTKIYWEDIRANEIITPNCILENFSVYLLNKSPVSENTKEYLQKLYSLTTNFFIYKNTYHYPFEFDYYDTTQELGYGYLVYNPSPISDHRHIISFVINHLDKMIEIYDATSRDEVSSYIEQYFHIRFAYGVNYSFKVFNNISFNLQDLNRKYEDRLCQAWSMLYLYNRLVRGYSMEEMRRIYISPLHILLREPSPGSSASSRTKETYQSALAYESGYANEAKNFIIRTIELISPEIPHKRNWFWSNLLITDNQELEKYIERQINILDTKFY